MSTIARGGATPGAGAPGREVRGASAKDLQRLVDEAACFNLFSLPATIGARVAVGRPGTIGLDIDEVLHRFDVTTEAPTPDEPLRASNRIGEAVGRFKHRWMIAPDDFVARPGAVPPPTLLDRERPQRFVMLDSQCTFGDGQDGFLGFGTGRTTPLFRDGRHALLATATGTIRQGFGRFAGHEEATYVYCGSLSETRGFCGNLFIRVMDAPGTLRARTDLPELREGRDPEAGVTYLVLRGEAVPSDPVGPNIGPDGGPIGLVVQQGLRLQRLRCTEGHSQGVRASDRVGPWVGRITAYVAFDPNYATGTAIDPVPFTAYDEFEFGRDGRVFGTITADSQEGRVFNLDVGGRPAIRFGGVGSIRGGTGPFRGFEGLMTDNSVVVFDPHVSASVYVFRVDDPRGRLHDAVRRSRP